MGNAIVKLVKKVKKLEGFLKRRNLVLTDSEDEEPETQGRKSQSPSTNKSGKRRKQMARKGMNTNVDEYDSEDSDKVDKQEETNTGTETPINPVP
ncbi:hypothetical protein Tco_1537057, partial [Tanacetum coccineum]